MSKRIYNFKDIFTLIYDDTTDTLIIDMKEEYLKEIFPEDFYGAKFCLKHDGSVTQKGYKFDKDSMIFFTTGIIFHDFTQIVNDSIEEKNGRTMKDLAEKFESLPLSKFNAAIQIYSEDFSLNDTYAVISTLYSLCSFGYDKNGFELVKYDNGEK